MLNNILFTNKFFQSQCLSDRLITSAHNVEVSTLFKENPKSVYDWSATGQRQTAFCVCQWEHWECRRPCAHSGRQSKNAPI